MLSDVTLSFELVDAYLEVYTLQKFYLIVKMRLGQTGMGRSGLLRGPMTIQ